MVVSPVDGGELDVLLLDPAGQQVVELLRHDRSGRADVVGQVVDFGDLPGRVVGHPERADLAFGHEFGDGGERVGQWRRPVGLMQIEQVDVVGAQTCQAALDARAQAGG